MNAEKSMADFNIALGQKPIVEEGEIYQGRTNINISSILTKLIQEAGRWCKDYASDLFISWAGIQTQIDNATLKPDSYLFGFREYGVDHNQFILSKYQTSGSIIASYEYRAIWRLDIELSDSDYYTKKVKFTLYEVSR